MLVFTRQPVSLCEARAEAWVETLFIKSLVSNLLQMCQTKKMRPLAEHCPPRCQETGQDVQYVTPLADNQFLITHPPRNLSVTCNAQQSSLRKNSSVGTLFVHLPYGCSLFPINGGRLQPRDQRVAQSGAAITHRTIIPAVWVKIRSMNVPRYQEPKPLFQALDDCVNNKWLQDYQLQETNPASFHPYLLSFLDILLLVIIVAVFWYLRRTITSFERAMYQYVESRITARLRGHDPPTLDMDTVRHRPPRRLPIPITEAQGPITHPGSPTRSTSPLLSHSATPTLGQPEYVSMDPYVRPIQ
jgi:hypothetical protein